MANPRQYASEIPALKRLAATAALAILTSILFVPITWAATRETVLHNFGDGANDGQIPLAGLIIDAAGNLYGTTLYGGTDDIGTVFELTPEADGSWTEKVLHSFKFKNFNETDGANPEAGLIFDRAGNLYGTTSQGGIHNNCYYGTCGTVFELSPNQDGSWTEKVLHSFNNTDGANPEAGLIFDTAGNLYGTTDQGGTYGFGTAFELTPQGDGGWTEKVLHSFNFNETDGANPEAGLIFDRAGNLYGTTNGSGSGSVGTVFELTPRADGSWKEKVLYSFDGSDGSNPEAGLILGAAGDLYGTTSSGGSDNLGTVFKLTPNADGDWTEKVLYSFNETDGAYPEAGLIFDASGNLYGTTVGGGTNNDGTVFELTSEGGGSWTEKVLHNFNGSDGFGPYAALIFDTAGNLYGTNSGGGTHNDGTAFELTP